MSDWSVVGAGQGHREEPQSTRMYRPEGRRGSGVPCISPSDAPGTGQEAGPQLFWGALTPGDTPSPRHGPIAWRATVALQSQPKQRRALLLAQIRLMLSAPRRPAELGRLRTTAFLDSGSAISWDNAAPLSVNHEL